MGGRALWTVAVLGLALSPIGSAAGAQVFFASRATYIVEHGEGEVTYDAADTQMPVLECDGQWDPVNAHASSAPDPGHEVSIDVREEVGEVRVTEAKDGTVIRAAFACDGSVKTSRPAPETGWRSHQETGSDGSSSSLVPAPVENGPCDGEPLFALERLAPFNDQARQDRLPTPGQEPACIEARGSAEVPEAGDVPFTGNVTATLSGPDGHEVWSRSCTMVVGTCWDGGQGSFELPEGSFQTTDQWTLTCDTGGLFDSFIPPVGTFSCRAWLG